MVNRGNFMTDEKILQALREIYRQIKRQSDLTEAIYLTLLANQAAPNIKRSLEDFPSFNWASVGAEILSVDNFGVAQVSWNGKIFTRRSPDNKFKEAIWFSCCVGKDEQGNNKYEKLITFTVIDPAEPISRKAEQLLKPANNIRAIGGGGQN